MATKYNWIIEKQIRDSKISWNWHKLYLRIKDTISYCNQEHDGYYFVNQRVINTVKDFDKERTAKDKFSARVELDTENEVVLVYNNFTGTDKLIFKIVNQIKS